MTLLAATPARPVIDLTGPKGNVFFLMGQVKPLGHQLEWSEEKIQAVRADMQSGNYSHAVKVFDREFGQFIDLMVPPSLEAELMA